MSIINKILNRGGDGLSEAQVDARVALYQPASGTFTPYLSDNSHNDSEGQTFSKQVGVYRKVGDVVTFFIHLTVTGIGTLTTTDPAFIEGLPFTSASLNTAFPAQAGVGTNLNLSAAAGLTGIVPIGLARVNLHKWSATTGHESLLISDVSADGNIIISGTYIAV